MSGGDQQREQAQRGLRAWAGFPADREPRPLVLLCPAVRAAPFGADVRAKLAFVRGAIEAVPGFPTDILHVMRRHRQEAGPPLDPLVVTTATFGTAEFLTDRGWRQLPAWEVRDGAAGRGIAGGPGRAAGVRPPGDDSVGGDPAQRRGPGRGSRSTCPHTQVTTPAVTGPSRSPDSTPSGPTRRPLTPREWADLPEQPGNGGQRTTAAPASTKYLKSVVLALEPGKQSVSTRASNGRWSRSGADSG
jgi:hypothetical protein